MHEHQAYNCAVVSIVMHLMTEIQYSARSEGSNQHRETNTFKNGKKSLNKIRKKGSAFIYKYDLRLDG